MAGACHTDDTDDIGTIDSKGFNESEACKSALIDVGPGVTGCSDSRKLFTVV